MKVLMCMAVLLAGAMALKREPLHFLPHKKREQNFLVGFFLSFAVTLYGFSSYTIIERNDWFRFGWPPGFLLLCMGGGLVLGVLFIGLCRDVLWPTPPTRWNVFGLTVCFWLVGMIQLWGWVAIINGALDGARSTTYRAPVSKFREVSGKAGTSYKITVEDWRDDESIKNKVLPAV